jgi:hypothetical protein
MSYYYKQSKQATMNTSNPNHLANILQKVSTNIINSNGTVNMSRYLELNSSSTDEDESLLLSDDTDPRTTNKEAEHTVQDSNESTNPNETTKTDNL